MLTGEDLKRPACGQCSKSRLVCGGPRSLAFVVYDGQEGAAAPKHEVYTADASTSMVTRTAETVEATSFTLIYRLPVSREEICTTFTRCNLLPENDHIIVPVNVDRTITTQCFLALSYTYFGVKHRETKITQDGLQ